MLFSLYRAFLYPSDLQLELEYWAETGEYDEDELHEVSGHVIMTCKVDNLLPEHFPYYQGGIGITPINVLSVLCFLWRKKCIIDIGF